MMKLRSKITIVGFLVTLILGIWVLFPKCQKLLILQKKIKSYESEIQLRKESKERLSQLSQKLESEAYHISLQKIDSALPSELSLPSLFNFLQEKAKENGLSLEKVGDVITRSFGKKSNIKAHSFNIVLSGKYSALKNFLPVLERSARLIEVEHISFSSPSQKKSLSGGEGIFSFNLRLRIHSY